MKNGSILKLVLGASAITLGLGAFGMANAKPAAQVDAANVTVTPGSDFYAFVPDSWIANSRFLTIKFKGTGTATSSSSAAGLKTEAFSVNSDTSVSHITSSYAGCDVYKLTLVSPFTHLFYCQVPSIPAGYSSFTWSQAQVLTYPSTVTTSEDWGSSAYKKWDGATTISNLSGNLVSVNPDAPVSAPVAASYSGTRAFVSDTEKVNEWAYTMIKTYGDGLCGSTQSYGVDDATAAGLFIAKGWPKQAPRLEGSDYATWNALTSKSLFTSATASSTSSLYYARFASLYNYILAKYGYYENNASAYLSNYAGRTITTFANANTASPVGIASNDSSSTLVLGGLAAAAVLVAGSYFFVRKRKAN